MVKPQPRWRHRRLRPGVVSLVAAVLVVVAVSVALVTAGSSLSSAQVRQKIAQASALSLKAGTVRVDQVITQKGEPAEHLYRVELPASGLSRLSYFDPVASVYITEVDNASNGYVRMTSSPTQPTAAHGWVSYPLDRVTNRAQVPPGSPGGLGGTVGPVSHLGTKDIGGVKATGYGVTVSVEALIAEAKDQAGRDLYRRSYLQRGITRFPAQVWLDASGHFRELTWTVHPRRMPAWSSRRFSLTAGPWPPSISRRPST